MRNPRTKRWSRKAGNKQVARAEQEHFRDFKRHYGRHSRWWEEGKSPPPQFLRKTHRSRWAGPFYLTLSNYWMIESDAPP